MTNNRPETQVAKTTMKKAMKKMSGASATAPVNEPGDKGSDADRHALGCYSKELVYATPGQSFYGLVLRALGDRRFHVENSATGSMVHCRLKGSMRRGERVLAGGWVLVSMREYESDTQHYDRKGEIVLRYTPTQLRQLIKAGEISERASGSDSVVFVEQDDWNKENAGSPSSPTSDASEDDEARDAVSETPKLLFAREEDLPSPATSKKSRRSSCRAADPLIAIDFHHAVGFLADSSLPVPVAQAASAPVLRSLPTTASTLVSIQARVKFWDQVSGTGYATPVDKSKTKGGVDVRLTAECVEGLKKVLLRNDLVQLTIDPTHDRPYVMPGGLRRAGSTQ
jgi:translation initiation factor 1A